MRLPRINRGKGIAYAIVSGMSFGFIPLFTLGAMHGGYTTFSILTYRFSFSTLLFGAMLAIQRVPVRVSFRQILDRRTSWCRLTTTSLRVSPPR